MVAVLGLLVGVFAGFVAAMHWGPTYCQFF
jgi:hypothetical protein